MHSISHIAYTDTSSVSLSLLSDSIRLMSVKESEYLHGIAGIAHHLIIPAQMWLLVYCDMRTVM